MTKVPQRRLLRRDNVSSAETTTRQNEPQTMRSQRNSSGMERAVRTVHATIRREPDSVRARFALVRLRRRAAPRRRGRSG